MSKPRSSVLGYNHNVVHHGWEFHIQTEDAGVQRASIMSHLFHGGTILATKKLAYDPGSQAEFVKDLMQAQHKAVLRELKNGVHDAVIERILAGVPKRDGALASLAPVTVPPPVDGSAVSGSSPRQRPLPPAPAARAAPQEAHAAMEPLPPLQVEVSMEDGPVTTPPRAREALQNSTWEWQVDDALASAVTAPPALHRPESGSRTPSLDWPAIRPRSPDPEPESADQGPPPGPPSPTPAASTTPTPAAALDPSVRPIKATIGAALGKAAKSAGTVLHVACRDPAEFLQASVDGASGRPALVLENLDDLALGAPVNLRLPFAYGPVRAYDINGQVAWRRPRSRGLLRAAMCVEFVDEIHASERLLHLLKTPRDARNRKHQRIPAGITVKLTPDGERSRKEDVDDISEGGVFIKTGNLLPVGDEADINIRPPGSLRGMHIRGRVTWHRAPPHEGMGLRFLFESDEQQQRMEGFVAKLLARTLGA